MSRYAFRLAYSQILCSRCGVKRIRGVECPDCGRRPESWEVDAATLERRKATVRAQTALLQPVTLPAAGQMGATEFLHAEVFVRLSEWMGVFFQATKATAEAKEEGAQALEAAIAQFMELRDLVQSADSRRPLGAMVKVLRELLGELESMVSAFLAALLATTPLQAQQQGAIAQRHMDRAAELAEQANAVSETLLLLTKEQDVARIQAGLLERTLQVYQVPDLLALDAVGRDQLHRETSSRGTYGAGILFSTYHVLAQHLLDADQFRDVLRRAYTVFSSHPDVLRTLATTAVFEEDFQRAVLELFDGSMEAAHAVENAVHSRQAGRALLGVASALVEGPGQVIATALLLACGRKTAAYANLRHKNATDMVSAVQQEPALQGLLDGLDNDLRTGRAHALVRYEEHAAVIERKSTTRTVAWADVIDGVFRGHENVLACNLALLQALGELGFNGFGLDGLWRSLGVTAEQMTTAVLETMGCHDVVITGDSKCWRIEASVGTNTPLPTLVAMLQPGLPPDLDELMLIAHQHDGTHVLAGPVAPWREQRGAPADSDAQQLAFLRAQLSWVYDDAPWLPVNFIRRWIAIQGAKTFEMSPAHAVARLRNLRQLAVLSKDDALVAALSGAIRHIRLGGDSDAVAALNQLSEWCVLPADGPTWWNAHPGWIH
ncbi:hypothetical protein HCJ76_00470 [Streptomyces sp. MC1]|uniref:hypothetical protein n=1 Tax=Streptomyces sp. MC1 TaxID=295105 RepID=UPI0018CBE4AC|nr:hypothetical protein [Streptomyces sp. MC1]MBG7696612.1 hypothetical protein [Streptomyces sp. MC1]